MTDPSIAPTLEEAWHRFGDGLRHWIARRLPKEADADDILQQVFLTMAASPPHEVPAERLGAWLYRVARNALVDQTRRERVRATKPLEPETTPHPDEEPVRRSLTRCLEPMLATLPPDNAEALRRVEFEGRSQKAVAAELGLSYSAMKSRVQRGRRLLRDNVEACCRPDEDLNCGGCEPEAPCHGAPDGE